MNNSDIDTLAAPDSTARKRSAELVRCVSDACADHGGWIGFAEYMNIVLYQPGLGYYTGGLQKFGEKGDFITAPEVSPLFGQCIARQIAEVFATDEWCTDDRKYCIEFGAGSGLLAVDVLLALESSRALPEKYFILELSAELQQRQADTIGARAPHLLSRVQWLNTLPEVDNAFVIANEVLDAMPVEVFRVGSGRDTGLPVESLSVGIHDGQPVGRYFSANERVSTYIREMVQRSELAFAAGYQSEFNPAIGGWLSAIERKIDKLVILLIDYGYNEREYYHPDRKDGTLMCYYRHKAHSDFFRWPGLQDITAFVNFTEVAYSADDCGLAVSGYTTQAAFLLASGLSDLHESQVSDDVRQQVKLSQQIKTLTLPSEMGERFKVMALTKNYHQPLRGFSMLDLRNRL